MWTHHDIRERFIEAAEIEQRLWVKGGPSTGGNAWPIYERSDEDLAGYDDQAMRDHLEAWQGRKAARSDEVLRWEQVYFQWTPLVRLHDRVLVWRFAHSAASGRSFSGYCEKKGVVLRTAYARIERNMRAIEVHFRNTSEPFQPSAKSALALEPERMAIECHTVSNYALKHPESWRDEESSDHLDTPEAVEAFTEYLAEINEERRRTQLRRAKSLNGVPEEARAA